MLELPRETKYFWIKIKKSDIDQTRIYGRDIRTWGGFLGLKILGLEFLQARRILNYIHINLFIY